MVHMTFSSSEDIATAVDPSGSPCPIMVKIQVSGTLDLRLPLMYDG